MIFKQRDEGQLENVTYGLKIGLQNSKIKTILAIATLIGFSNSWFYAFLFPSLAWLLQIFSVWHCYYSYVENVLKTDLKAWCLKIAVNGLILQHF